LYDVTNCKKKHVEEIIFQKIEYCNTLENDSLEWKW